MIESRLRMGLGLCWGSNGPAALLVVTKLHRLLTNGALVVESSSISTLLLGPGRSVQDAGDIIQDNEPMQ